jgi:hypothetical protein
VNESELTHELRKITGQSDFLAQNCSVTLGDPIVQERVLREVLANGAPPRFVIFESSPEFLNEYSQFYPYHLRRQFNWEDVPAQAHQICITGAVKRLLVLRFTPLYDFRYQLLKQAATGFAPLAAPYAESPPDSMTEAEWSDLRSRPRPLTKSQESGIYGETAPDMPWLRNYRLGGNAPLKLEKMIIDCQRRGIRPIIVGAPVASVYRAKYTPAIREAYQQVIDRLKDRYNVDYVECRDSMLDHHFCDTHHVMSPASAVVFSRILAREVLAPLIASPSGPLPARTVGFDKNQAKSPSPLP